MKKLYDKPNAEFLSFRLRDEVADGTLTTSGANVTPIPTGDPFNGYTWGEDAGLG